ncbi:MAG: hypothetical protein M3R43_09375 [Acidobacteriota bacterium]|nr:hypothetical protein [Acidobacteriota bacterium]
MPVLKLPKFENEAEEARWWYDHREEVGAELVAASKEGRLGPGTRARFEARLREQRAAESDTKDVLTSAGS